MSLMKKYLKSAFFEPLTHFILEQVSSKTLSRDFTFATNLRYFIWYPSHPRERPDAAVARRVGRLLPVQVHRCKTEDRTLKAPKMITTDLNH